MDDSMTDTNPSKMGTFVPSFESASKQGTDSFRLLATLLCTLYLLCTHTCIVKRGTLGIYVEGVQKGGKTRYNN